MRHPKHPNPLATLLLALAALLATALPSAAYDFMVGGLCYNINSDGTTVTVTYESYMSSSNYSSLSGTLTIPSSVSYGGTTYSITSIDDSAFCDCSGLTSVTIPNTVSKIGSRAFMSCSSLTSVNIPNSVTLIDYASFFGCSSLTSISIPKSVTSIGYWAFRECSSLTSVNIPNSVTSIGELSFWECSSLTSVTIPNSVTKIGKNAFNYCSKLSGVHISDIANWCKIDFGNDYSNPLRYAKHLYLNGEEITILDIPNSVTSIGNNAFINCSSLTKINIPNSVTQIGMQAFYGCNSLTNVIIPNSVTQIGEKAFSDCNSLKYIKCNPLTPPSISSYICSITSPIIVSKSALWAYKEHEQWSKHNLRSNFIFWEAGLASIKVMSEDRSVSKLNSVSINGSNKTVANDTCAITNLEPDIEYSLTITSTTSGETEEETVKIKTRKLNFSNQSTSTQTSIKAIFVINKDISFVPTEIQAEIDGTGYPARITSTTATSYTIEAEPATGLMINSSHSVRLAFKYAGKEYQSDSYTVKTKSIGTATSMNGGPTTMRMDASYTAGDARVTDAYFTFNGTKSRNLRLTGLKPNTSYTASYTIETATGNQSESHQFTTEALTLATQAARMLTNTSPMFIATTNIADEETSCGFEWRRNDAPAEMPSTTVYCPVYGGTMAGTLKNMTEGVYYKYRPFYKASDGTMYYGDWIAFITADAFVEFAPVVYTYSSPEVTTTGATLSGVALRGSSEITSQGFEYWRVGGGSHAARRAPSSGVTRVTAAGERMKVTVSDLSPATTYRFRSFVEAGGVTTYGDEVEFTTDRPSYDVNVDGKVDVGDVNAVLGDILGGGKTAAYDVNGDDRVDVGDVNAILADILAK